MRAGIVSILAFHMTSSSGHGSAFQVLRAIDGFRTSESAAGIRKVQ